MSFDQPLAEIAARALPPFALPEPITPAWAWEDAHGEGIRVGLIDSGADVTHPALANQISGYVAVADGLAEERFDTSAHGDDSGHGTACAGIIRALAPACELYSIKVLDQSPLPRARALATAIRWGIEHEMRVLNVSVGTTRPEFYGILHELADLACFRNVMLVTAASQRPGPSYPAHFASVVSVVAQATDDPYEFYYHPASPAEFGARGYNLRVAWRDGTWISATGNSLAAPQLSGIIAQLLSKHPDLTAFHVKSVLYALAANVARP